MRRTELAKNYELPSLNLKDQLRAGRHLRRWLQLVAGLVLAALSVAMMVEAHLGLDPWNVLHEGLVKHLGLSFGAVTVLSGVVVLLLWIPLRQPLGAGTIVNALLIGGLVDVALWLVPTPDELWVRAMFLLVGVVLCGAAGRGDPGGHPPPGAPGGL